MFTETAKEFYERMNKNAHIAITDYQLDTQALILYLESIAYSLAMIADKLKESDS